MSITIMGENFNPTRRVIKNNGIFLVTDQSGNVISDNTSGYGLYLDDTRFLSRMELKINNIDIINLLSSTEAGHSSIIIATNPLMYDIRDSEKQIFQETVEIKRESIIYGAYFETITIANFNSVDVGVRLELFFGADFLDMFEVRNISGVIKGTQGESISNLDTLSYVYQDTTGATLATEIEFIEENPIIIESNRVMFEFDIAAGKRVFVKFQIRLRSTASLPEKISAYDYVQAFEKVLVDDKNWTNNTSYFLSNNEDFNEMLNRSHRDINMLITRAYYGEYIAAGIPWFTTLFGRDSLITARQALILNPDIAKKILETLAKFQGKEVNDWRDEEPGKIPHEIRFGELARSNKIPHSPYFGSVDSTMLWIILLYEYFKWTDDRETLEKLWQNALNCLMWMDKYVLKLNGFAAYKTRSVEGLRNQGWKDSWNSCMHQDGSIADLPIALTEVQGLFYLARVNLAELAQYMGETELNKRLLIEARDFKERFHRHYWIDEIQYYAMGLDGNNNPLKVISSNPGQCIETGIIDNYYANIIADRLFQPDMFSGWGIRTLSKKEVAYNPMSYHNGSVWPHDNSIIASGLSKIKRIDLALVTTTAIFDAARLIFYKRLPELFCGFTREYRRQDPPVMYPVACSPQAWAAGSVFMFIQSMLSLYPDAQKNELVVNNPVIPNWMSYLRIENLRIGKSSLDIEFRRTGKGFVTDILEKRGNLDIIIRK